MKKNDGKKASSNLITFSAAAVILVFSLVWAAGNQATEQARAAPVGGPSPRLRNTPGSINIGSVVPNPADTNALVSGTASGGVEQTAQNLGCPTGGVSTVYSRASQILSPGTWATSNGQTGTFTLSVISVGQDSDGCPSSPGVSVWQYNYSFTIDTSAFPAGTYTLAVSAVDDLGRTVSNTGTFSVAHNAAPPPTTCYEARVTKCGRTLMTCGLVGSQSRFYTTSCAFQTGSCTPVLPNFCITEQADISCVPVASSFCAGTGTLACNSTGNPAPQAFTITNNGGGTLNWTAASGQPWLSIAPSSGSLAGGLSTNVMVSADKSSLTGPGMYVGTITVSGNAPAKSETVTFTLN